MKIAMGRADFTAVGTGAVDLEIVTLDWVHTFAATCGRRPYVLFPVLLEGGCSFCP
ncbi:hypothetical protein [Streptosporangium vulgare]|uniref:Uncharacterized protein n=1 Tax=Streptosporangium vulgare TaxID=46190 RepID=A0ABV5TLX7_9ACTN